MNNIDLDKIYENRRKERDRFTSTGVPKRKGVFPIHRMLKSVLERDRILDSERKHIYAFIVGHEPENGVVDKNRYVDVYVDDHGRLNRFIIYGRRFNIREEERFLSYTHDPDLFFRSGIYLLLLKRMEQVFPEICIKVYEDLRVNTSLVLEKLYFSSFSSGTREILFMSDLDVIAHHLDQIPHQMEGKTPAEIIGLPMRSLRLLNHPTVVQFLYRKESIEEIKMV